MKSRDEIEGDMDSIERIKESIWPLRFWELPEKIKENIVLAYRHLEDAWMRLGIVMEEK